MADNPTINGVPIAGDDLTDGTGPVHQLVGIEFGGPNALTRVTAANPLPSYTPPDTALGAGGVAGTTIGTTSATVIAANTGRKRVDVSNGHATGGLWLRPGGGTAVAGQGWYLPPNAKDTYYTTLAITAIGTTTGISVGTVEW